MDELRRVQASDMDDIIILGSGIDKRVVFIGLRTRLQLINRGLREAQ